MSTSRLFSMLIAVVLFVTTFFVIRTGVATSAVGSELDQSDRHPGFTQPSLPVDTQAWIEYRRGEWHAGSSTGSVALDQSDRHPGFTQPSLSVDTQAGIEDRRRKWHADSSTGSVALDQSDRHPSITQPSLPVDTQAQ